MLKYHSVAPIPSDRKIHKQKGVCRTYFETSRKVVGAPPPQLRPSMKVAPGKELFVFYVNDYSAAAEPQLWSYECREDDMGRHWYGARIGDKREMYGSTYYLSLQRLKKTVCWVGLYTYQQHRRDDV